MKKLLSLVLTLALALTLTAPAFAMPYLSTSELLGSPNTCPALTVTPEQRAAWLTAHPDEAAAFDPYAWFEESYFYYDSVEEYMQDMGLEAQADFEAAMRDKWVDSRMAKEAAQAEIQAWLDAHPDEAASFDPHAWYDYYHFDEDSVEDYMAYTGLETQADFEAAMRDEWVDERMAQEAAQADALARVAARVSSLGGTPGQINVMVNGKCLSFGAKAPKMTDGTLSAPADVLSRTLGVQVKGDNQGYAPLRFTAESAGWTVLWDQEYQTAVLVNEIALISDLQTEFTQLDALYARLLETANRQAGQSYRTQSTADFDLLLFDTLNGDKTYDLKLRSDLLLRDDAFSATFTVDAASLMSLITADQVKALFGDGISLSKLKELSKSLKVELIYNPQAGMAYWKAPILAQLTSGKVPEAGEWISLDFDGPISADPQALPTPSLLMASAIYQQTLNQTSYGYWGTPIDFHDFLATNRAPYVTVVGNSRFTEKNGALTYTLDAKIMNDLLRSSGSDPYGSAYMGDLFKSCDFIITAGQDGRLNMKIDIESDFGQAGGMGTLTSFLIGNFRYRGQAAGSAETSTGSLEFHWQNRLKLTCDLSEQARPVSDPPRSAPPEGAQITPLEELDDLFYDAGFEALYYLLP